MTRVNAVLPMDRRPIGTTIRALEEGRGTNGKKARGLAQARAARETAEDSLA